jgi:hypothetical protein
MIEFTKGAKEFISGKGIKEIYLVLTYVKGPCSDNLCKMIPRVVVALERGQDSSMVLLEDSEVKVFADRPVADSVKRHRNVVTVSKSKFGNRLRVSGITYSY